MAKSSSNSISALLVGDFDSDASLVRDVFQVNQWSLEHARDRRQALELLRRPVPVVVAEASIPSWNWRDILWDLHNLSHSAQLIITSRHADEYLWSEVLNEGAFDLLAQPLAGHRGCRSTGARTSSSPSLQPQKIGKQGSISYLRGSPDFSPEKLLLTLVADAILNESPKLRVLRCGAPCETLHWASASWYKG